VSVVGEFDGWNAGADPLARTDGGIWEGFVGGLGVYDVYKFAITGADGKTRLKADPYAFHAETRPGTASKLYDISGYGWGDEKWTSSKTPVYDRPLNIYEVHLGSWKRHENGDGLSYRELAEQLPKYVKSLGYNCIELLPVTEHPLDASWGYQCTGYFAPTSRFGTPHDFMYFVDRCHRAGLAVILDWVPAHFCKDDFGLYEFDGGCCYEYSDPLKREHAAWGTRVFDYGRGEVESFLLSSAAYWLTQYHIDGLRVDAVASMLYLDYDRRDWSPNENGGRENLEAVKFLQDLNVMAFSIDPNVMMVAEESTAWPLVTYPTDAGGLGFNLKWNMGWMNDMTHYMKMDPYFRGGNHRDLTFSMMYAFSENFVLPISHDEVVHMKGSLLGKMPGDAELKAAGVRAFCTYMLAHPGKKLMFMGAEIGQENEWHFEGQLDWELLENDYNARLNEFFKAANRFYNKNSELWQIDFEWSGFEWLVSDDSTNNTAVFVRRSRKGGELIAAVNFSPNRLDGYRFGVPPRAKWTEVFSSDETRFGGTGALNAEPLETQDVPSHGKPCSIAATLPPMGAAIFRGSGKWSGAKTRAKRGD
jgi:1,4-alpha-glucan branching enzyme